MCGSCSQMRPTSNCDTAEASNRPCTPGADLLPAVVCILLNSLKGDRFPVLCVPHTQVIEVFCVCSWNV